MSNRIDTKIVLGSYRYKTSIDTDLLINVPLQGNQREFDEFDRNNTISLTQVFDDERQACKIFRPTAEIDFIFSNAYSGTTGIVGNDYPPFTNSMYYVNTSTSLSTNVWSGFPQYYEFDFVRNDYNVLNYTSGPNPHVNFIKRDASKYNWTYFLSYVSGNDYNKVLQYYLTSTSYINWVCSQGIPFTIANPSIINGRTLISFICPVKHGLTPGEYVEINIPGWAGYNGRKTFEVYSLGTGGETSKEYIFNIYNYGFLGTSFTDGNHGTFKRIIDIENSGETISKYYVRKHTIITDLDDAILHKAGFNQNIFGLKRQYEYETLTPDNQSRITIKEGNQSYLISFSKDIDISQYYDNLNRPLSEFYFTFVYRGYFGWMNLPWNTAIPNAPAIKQGYDFNITYSLSNYWDSLNTLNLSNIQTDSYVKSGAFTFYHNKILKSGDTMDGAFCEFNQFEQKERVISDYYHKISYNHNLFKIGYLINGPAISLPQRTSNPEGYYYRPHYPLTLSVFSSYIEEGDIRTIDLAPNYAYYSNYYQKLRWRDMYTYGYIDSDGLGVDYPYLNDSHYPSTKIIFRLMPEGYISQNLNNIATPTIDDCE